MTAKFLSPIKDIIKDAKKGKMFLLVDDKNRENIIQNETAIQKEAKGDTENKKETF